MKISVIVPVYNVEKYLEECIFSILNQTFKDFELILVDDGSTDNSGKICDDFAEKDDRIIVIHQKNSGQAAARNRALEIASGEWIMFVDSDDMIHPMALEILYDVSVNSEVNMSICKCATGTTYCLDKIKSNENVHFKSFNINEAAMFDILRCKGTGFYWVVWAKLIKKSCINDILFTPGRIYEDNAIAFKWIINSNKISLIDEKLYFHRSNPNSTVGNPSFKNTIDYLWAISENVNYYEKIGYNLLLDHFCSMYIQLSVSTLNDIKNTGKNTEHFDKILNDAWDVFIKHKRKCIFHNKHNYIEALLKYKGRSKIYRKLYVYLFRFSKIFKVIRKQYVEI